MYDEAFVSRTIEARMAEIKCGSIEEYTALFERDSTEEDALFGSFQICHSEFFRNALTFSVLEQFVLPRLLMKAKENRRSEVRIWSAGCACGQEPYSIALLLEELVRRSSPSISFRIFATDLSEIHINAARRGLFTKETIGNTPLKWVQKWFSPVGSEYAISPILATNIDFSVYELLDDRSVSPPSSVFGDFDLVLCCNLLYYYKPKPQKLVLDKIKSSLGQDAFLVTGEAERGIVAQTGFHEIFPSTAIFSSNESFFRMEKKN